MLSVKKILPAKAFPFIAKAGVVIGLMVCLALAKSAPPKIDRILSVTNFGQPQVEIHFSIEANRMYVLEYNTNHFATTNWSPLRTVPALPVTNHGIVDDPRTNKSRFYRLRATP